MIYFVYILILATLCVFSITTSESHLAQTLVNYFPKEAVFAVFGSLTIGCSFITKGTNRKLYNKYLFAFLIFIVFQFFIYFYYPTFKILENDKFVINVWAIKPFINILIGILLIKTLAENLSTKNWIDIFKFLCWVGFFVSVYALLQWCGIDPIGNNFEKNFINKQFNRSELMITFLSHKTLTAAYISLIVPLCLMFSEKKYKCFLAVMIFSLLLIDSFLALISSIISILLFFLISKRFKVFIGIILICIVSIFVLNVNYKNFLSDNGRVAFWKESAIDVLSNKPFIGMGHGSFQRKYGDTNPVYENVVLFAHNDYVQELNEGGLPGFVIMMMFLFSLFYKALFNIAGKYFIVDIVIFCSLVGLCTTAGGCFPFHYPPLAVIGILYISYIEYQNINIGRLK